MDLRQEIALVIREAMDRGSLVPDDIADHVLAIPEIADALTAQTAQHMANKMSDWKRRLGPLSLNR